MPVSSVTAAISAVPPILLILAKLKSSPRLNKIKITPMSDQTVILAVSTTFGSRLKCGWQRSLPKYSLKPKAD